MYACMYVCKIDRMAEENRCCTASFVYGVYVVIFSSLLSHLFTQLTSPSVQVRRFYFDSIKFNDINFPHLKNTVVIYNQLPHQSETNKHTHTQTAILLSQIQNYSTTILCVLSESETLNKINERTNKKLKKKKQQTNQLLCDRYICMYARMLLLLLFRLLAQLKSWVSLAVL